MSLDRAVAEARQVGGAATVLRIGCSPYVPIEVLQQFLATLHDRDPRQPTQTTHVVAVDQIALLRVGELDLGIFPGAYNGADLETEQLAAGEPLALLMPPDHRLAAKPVISPEDVKDEDLLIIPRAPNPAYHDGLLAHIENAGYRFRRVVEIRAMTVREVLFGIADGLGLAFAPKLAELSGTDAIAVRRPLDPPLSMPDTLVAWRKVGRRESHPALELVRAVARDLHGRTVAA